jgi:hypothetical protein
MDPQIIVLACVLFASGVFTIAGAVLNWDWFMNSRRAWIFVKLFGRNGARVVYGVFGLVFLACAVTVLIAGK